MDTFCNSVRRSEKSADKRDGAIRTPFPRPVLLFPFVPSDAFGGAGAVCTVLFAFAAVLDGFARFMIAMIPQQEIATWGAGLGR